MSFSELWQWPLTTLLDPGERIFFVYWLIAAAVAWLTLWWQARKGPLKALVAVCDPRVWTHRSAKLDFQLLMFNATLRVLLLGGTMVSALGVAKITLRGLTFCFGSPNLSWGTSAWMVGLYTLVNFVTLDFSRFYQHYLFHHIPALWRIHRVHHSAEVLNPITLYRTHPLESLVAAIRRSLVIGGVSGFFIYLSQGYINVYTILGVNGIDFLFNFAASNLRHSHVWLSFGPLNRIFISPAHHQIHHSRAAKHHNKNLGFSLSIWDQLFKTYYAISSREYLRFGVEGERNHTFLHNLISPILPENQVLRMLSFADLVAFTHKGFARFFLRLEQRDLKARAQEAVNKLT